jgi:hypothetical protein
MKSVQKLAMACALMAMTLHAGLNLSAQDTDGDEIIELSPFVVEGSNSEGYLATTTLAGTRLKTELRDVGSAISVLTEEFFDDTGATNADTVLAYGLNTEVAGVQGNFSNVEGTNDGRSSTINSRTNSQSSQRVRGLSRASLTRGYFLTDIPFDDYNTTAVTINRGPNSLLFGIGTPGGVIDNAVKQAYTTKQFGEIGIRIGERGSNRETLDYNLPVYEGRLGIRVAAVREDNQYQQKPAFEKTKRVYAALNAVLFENENSSILGPTMIRGNVEYGKINGTPPNIVPRSDGLTNWFELPDNLDEIEAITGVAPSPFVETFLPKYTVDNRNGDITPAVLNQNGGPTQIPFFIQMPYIYTDPTASGPSVGLADPSIHGVQGRVRWAAGGAQNVPDYVAGNSELFSTEHYFGNNRAGGPRAPGWSYPVVMDRRIYDNEDLLLAGRSNVREQEFDVVSFAIDQTFLDGDAGIEFAYDQQSYSNYTYLPFSDAQFQDLKIDISATLANGQPNPNYGRAYIWETGTAPRNLNETDREVFNMTAYYELDLTDSDNKFLNMLGRHTFTGFLGDQTIDTTGRNFRNVLVDIGDTNVASAMNAQVHQFRRSLPIQVYVTPSLLGNDVQSVSDIRITDYFHGSVPQPGDVTRQAYNTWNPVFQTENDRLLVDDFGVEQFLIGGNRRRQEIESRVFSWQSFLFDGNIVALLGWRNDKSTTINQITTAAYEELTGVPNYRFEDGSYDEGALILGQNEEDRSVQEGNTFTWSVVGHVPRNWLKLPYNSQLSFHYNESENFSASGARRDFYGNVLGAPSGGTKEYGFTLSTLEDKRSIRVNWFETTNANSTVTGGPEGPPSWIGGGMTRYKDAELGGESLEETLAKSVKVPNAGDLFPTWESLYDEMLSMLPQVVQDRFEGFDAAGTPIFTPNPGQAITQSFVSEGFEVDIVGSLTKNWTVALNIAQQETITSDTAPVASDFVLTVQQNLANSPLGDMIDSPVQNEATTFSERWASQQVNPLAALLAKDNTVSQEQRRWRVNFVTNYRFTDGFLEGFGIGGALRWQDKVATGYQVEVTDGLVTPLVDRPFFGPDELNGDIWLSYRTKITQRVDWKIQVNVRNLIRDDDYIPIVTNPDGRVAIVRNPNPMEIFITNTFSF